MEPYRLQLPARQPSGHLLSRPRLHQLTLLLCPELSELMLTKSFSNPFLWPVSEYQLRLHFPLGVLFLWSGIQMFFLMFLSVKVSLKILTWF